MRYVSFSLWGSNPKYLVGAIENVKLAKEIYPDWVCRFYFPCDRSLFDPELLSTIMQLEAHGAQIRSGNGDMPPMYHRFLIADEPDAEYFIVRDCDSRLSLREKAAVDQWIASGKVLHSMRDHPAHCRGLNGGLFGAKGGSLPNMLSSIQDWLKTLKAKGQTEFIYNDDQEFLGRYIWTRFSMHSMQHDSCCNYQDSLPFPTRRLGYRFVGEVYEADGTPRERDWEQVIPNQ